jgi:3-oxoacyl-[acyl-carrier protein] reductase
VTASATGHVVVTGGASGIGEVTALALIDEGVAVTILDAGAEAVSRMEDRLAGEDILTLTCDVTDEEEVADCLSQAVDAFGPVTGLVNCAGIARDIPAEKTSAEIFRQILDVNLTGSFITCRACLDQMGDTLSIVNLSSASGIRANAGRVAYGASKAGVILMSQVLANEWGASGVRVNVVAPGTGRHAADRGPSHHRRPQALDRSDSAPPLRPPRRNRRRHPVPALAESRLHQRPRSGR